MAARFRLVARGRGGEEHFAETGEGGPGRDHGRVRPPRLHGMIERRGGATSSRKWNSCWARLKNVPGFRELAGCGVCGQEPQPRPAAMLAETGIQLHKDPLVTYSYRNTTKLPELFEINALSYRQGKGGKNIALFHR